MAASGQATSIRGAALLDEIEFTGNQAVEGIFNSAGNCVDVSAATNFKFPTALPGVAGQVVTSDTAGVSSYSATCDSIQMAVPGEFTITGAAGASEGFLGSIAVDETNFTPGTIWLGLTVSHNNLGAGLAPTIHLRRLNATSYANNAALIAAASITTIVISAGVTAEFTLASNDDSGSPFAVSANAIYAVTAAMNAGFADETCDLRDMTVHIHVAT